MDNVIPIWVGVVTATGTILGVVIGGLIALWNNKIQLQAQEARERRKHYLEKFDELSQKIEEVRHFFPSLAGVPVYGQTYFYSKPKVDDLSSPLARVKALTYLYAPELVPSFRELEDCYSPYLKRIQERVQLMNADEKPQREEYEHAEYLIEKEDRKLASLCDTMQLKVAEIAKCYI